MKTVVPRRREAGQAIILTAAALVVLMGFAGLAIDMGVMRYEKRLEQTAADAAAIAGASNLTFGGIQTGAQNATGYSVIGGNQVSDCTGAPVGTVCVEVNNPPLTGPHQADSTGNCPPAPSCYVEAIVAVVQPTYFMKALSINSETIIARAVATNLGGAAGDGCLYTLGTPSSAVSGIDLNRRATLNASSCGIVDNGDFNDRGRVTADTFAVSGNASGGGGRNACTTPSPCPTYNTPATSDPLAYLTPPPVQTPSNGNFSTTSSPIPQTIQPGTYSSLTVVNNSNVTFAPGIYYINGPGPNGLVLQATATVRGTNVTFYFTNGASVSASGSDIQLTAPSTGSYAGILMYQDPADINTGTNPANGTGPAISAQNNSFFNGALYFPQDKLTISGGAAGAPVKVGIVVAGSVLLNGNSDVNLQGSAGLPAGVTLIRTATLVE